MPALPDTLLDAIVRGASDQAHAERLVDEWTAVAHQTAQAADRIRRQVREAPCSCARSAPGGDGRCGRCHGLSEGRS